MHVLCIIHAHDRAVCHVKAAAVLRGFIAEQVVGGLVTQAKIVSDFVGDCESLSDRGVCCVDNDHRPVGLAQEDTGYPVVVERFSDDADPFGGRQLGDRGGRFGDPMPVQEFLGSRFDQSFADGEADERCGLVDAQFPHQPRPVGIHGSSRQPELGGDLPIRPSRADAIQDHLFAPGQGTDRARSGSRAGTKR